MAELLSWRDDGSLLDATSSITNRTTGFGTNRQKSLLAETNLHIHTLSWEELISLYRSNRIIERLVDLPPEDAATYWGEWVLGSYDGDSSQDIINGLDEYCDRLDIVDKFIDAGKDGRLLGDGFIVLDVQDGEEWDQPVNMEAIKSIGFAEVLNKLELQPQTWRSVANPEHFRFNYSQDAPTNVVETNYRVIHKDRLLRLPGKRLNVLGLRMTGGYNDSVIQPFFNEFSSYMQGVFSATGMLNDYNIFTYKLNGLQQLALQNNTSALVNRFAAIQMGMSNFRGLMMDAENEDAQFINRNLAGVDKLVEKLEDTLVTASGFPRSKILGYPGTNALSEGGNTDRYLWAEIVARYQKTVWAKPRLKLGRYILAAKDGPTNGNLIDSLGFNWESALQLTDAEQAELEKVYAETDAIRINSGSIKPIESRGRLQSQDFLTHLTLNEEVSGDMESRVLEDTPEINENPSELNPNDKKRSDSIKRLESLTEDELNILLKRFG